MVADIVAITMTTVASNRPPPDTTLHITDTPTPRWLAAFRYDGHPIPPDVVPIVTKAEHPLFASLAGPADEMFASARGAINGQWLGITALEVAEAQRRRGLGRALLTALITYAADTGCRHVWLQVARDNAPARALYEQLGFTEHHHYVYRRLDSVPG
jgi:GNAT superfamily N-acetyltransferase